MVHRVAWGVSVVLSGVAGLSACTANLPDVGEPAICGNGRVEPPETCDDSNQRLDDACPSGPQGTCRDALCGDGHVWAGHEACDDGNQVDDDACVSIGQLRCVVARCGDGLVWTSAGGQEQCDAGSELSDLPCAGCCRSTCRLQRCGDGIADSAAGEGCDDGDAVTGDGCDQDCRVEPGWSCPGNQCQPLCEVVTCNDYNGGCRAGGQCDAASDPPCYYTDAASDGLPCVLDGDTDLVQRGVCFQAECVACLRGADCRFPPPPGDVSCFTAVCSDHQCAYELQPGQTCRPQVCEHGLETPPRGCDGQGLCLPQDAASCAPYTCDAGGSQCLDACSEDHDCVPEYFCDLAACEPQRGDGQACAPALGGRDCLSGHCRNGFCCRSGDCCGQAIDCPAIYSVGDQCDQPAFCAGHRVDPTCLDFMCGSTEIPDDSLCAGRVADACGTYRDVLCDGASESAPGACLADCAGDDDNCDAGYYCVGATCGPPAGVGAACPTPPCGTDLHCGDTQSPSAPICCADGARCCRQTDDDCLGHLACNDALYECYASCGVAPELDERCASGYHCEAGSCIADLGAGGSCNELSDCRAGLKCQNGVCCNEGQTCCSVHSQCPDPCYKCGSASYCVLQSSSEDLKSLCATGSTRELGCATGLCSGAANTCGAVTSGDGSCPVCQRCTEPATLACSDYPNNSPDDGCNAAAGDCMVCVGGDCTWQGSGADLWGECTAASTLDWGCATGNCSGTGQICGAFTTGDRSCPPCNECSDYDPACEPKPGSEYADDGCNSNHYRCDASGACVIFVDDVICINATTGINSCSYRCQNAIPPRELCQGVYTNSTCTIRKFTAGCGDMSPAAYCKCANYKYD